MLTCLSNPRCLSYLPGLVILFTSGSYTLVKCLDLSATWGLRSVLTLERGDIVLHVVERQSFSFTTLSSKPEPRFCVPTVQEFREMWKAWDPVTLGMISSHLFHVKPIDLRHKCLSYLSHIPKWCTALSRITPHDAWSLICTSRFYNMLLSKFLRLPYVEPRKFTSIFEVGLLHVPCS